MTPHSQGRVKFPTGGIARERLRQVNESKVSRFGETPKPTVTVWMEEN